MEDAQTVTVKVLFFAKAREIAGTNCGTLSINSSIYYDILLNAIVTKYSLDKIKNNVILAINEEYSNTKDRINLKDGDEIADNQQSVMDFIKIVDSKLEVEEISNLVTKSTCGAVSLFIGTTREYFEDKKVIHLEYEAYEPMAVKAIKKICEDIRSKWKVENIAIYHRIGIVPVKEASVVIAVSSVHRSESLHAIQYAIDSLKASAPIWKKEVYEISSAEWKENQESQSFDGYNLEEHSYIKTEARKPLYVLEEESVPSHLIQINASADEIQRRIDKFIVRKRDAVNIGNIRYFCQSYSHEPKESSCARVDAVLVRRKDSKGHLRVRRVLNKWGPQTSGLDPGSVVDPKAEQPGKEKLPCDNTSSFPGIEERLSNAEKYLGVRNGPIPKDVYQRLKEIEEKILFLESISPEYNSWVPVPEKQFKKELMKYKKKAHTLTDVERKILQLEGKLSMESQ